MANTETRNEKELKKAEQAGNLDPNPNFSGKSPRGDNNSSVNENQVENAFVRSTTDKKTTGRETGLVNSPEVALSPTGADSAAKKDDSWQSGKLLTVENAFVPNLNSPINYDAHPLLKLDRDQGVFVPNRPGVTTDDLLEQINKEVHHLKGYCAEQERDINGDGILESIIVEERKRNDDGTVQLTNGKPIVGALQQNRPKMILTRNFLAAPVVKGSEIGDSQKAPEDGVLVIRVL